ncbi:MAG: hypothetical protein KIT87_05690 [Anaerolineae bacterium]|nr:hypothetical protein [Anaerolineae bacterium]
MGNDLVSRVGGGGKLLALLGLVALLVVLGGLMAAPAEATSALIANKTMEGSLKLQPGDWVAAGYVLRVKGKTHPAMTVRLRNAYVVLGLRCDGSSTRVGTVIVPLYPTQGGGARTFSVAAGDESWWPTKDTNDADGYQGAVRVLDRSLCPAGKALINDGSAGGASFVAEIEGDNQATDIEVKFHYRVPRAKDKANINCADETLNPSPGISACSAGWSSSTTLRATALGEWADANIPPQINGYAFNDANSNGIQDAGEPGLGGVMVQVYDTVSGQLVDSEPTEAVLAFYLGYYNLLMPGSATYRVVATVPAGYTSTTPTDQFVFVPLDGGATRNFGLRPTP